MRRSPGRVIPTNIRTHRRLDGVALVRHEGAHRRLLRLRDSCDRSLDCTDVVSRGEQDLQPSYAGRHRDHVADFRKFVDVHRVILLARQSGNSATNVTGQGLHLFQRTISIFRSLVCFASALKSSSWSAEITPKQIPFRSPSTARVLKTCSGGKPIFAATNRQDSRRSHVTHS